MNEATEMDQRLLLDANAAAGALYDVFAREMTASPARCACCGREGELGSLLAFMQAPGIVLRCPACENVVLRIVRTPGAIYLDARGATYLCLRRA